MEQVSQRDSTTAPGKFAALVLFGILSACGGGNSGTGGSNDHESVRPVNTLFTRVGLDVGPDGLQISGDLGASIDSGANVTFKNPDIENQTFPYNFTFASGLPGGSISNANAGLVTVAQPWANKTINILAPGVTRNVQNVFWFNSNNPAVYGFGAAGYLLEPGKTVWPTSGIAQYRGQAFQYVVDSDHVAPAYDGYALLTSEASAVVDYAAKTLVITIGSGATQQWITQNSSVYGLNGRLPATSLNLQELEFTEQYLFYQLAPYQKSGLGLGLSYVDTVNFFGAHAEELAGVVDYSDAALGTSGYTTTYQTISFALVRQ